MWLIGSVLKHCKVPKYYDQDCSYISYLLKNCGTNKAAGIDYLSGRFLKDGADILNIPTSQVCNLSIKFSHFPKDCKAA